MTVSTIQLGKVVDVSAGQPAPKPNDFSDDGFPFIRAGSLEGLLSGQTENDCEKIDAETARRYRMRLYPKDTILFAKSGMSAKIGRVYRMRQPAYVVSHLAALAPIGKYEPSYLVHWLRAHPPSKLIKDEAYPSIRTSEVSSLEVPDLHIDEQRRIAATLDKADTVRRKREQTLTLADELLQSVFLEMFGDPLSNPMGWPVQTLGAHLEEIRYGTSEKCGDETPEQDIPVLRIPNVVNGVIDWTDLKFTSLNVKERERLLLADGDILFVRTNGNPNYIGRCAVFEGNRPAAFASYLIRARLRDDAPVTPRFVSNCLSMPSYRSRMIQEAKTTAGNYNANTTGLRSLPIIEPPKKMQAAYARVVAGTNKSTVNMGTDLKEANELFAALSQRAFRGEL